MLNRIIYCWLMFMSLFQYKPKTDTPTQVKKVGRPRKLNATQKAKLKTAWQNLPLGFMIVDMAALEADIISDCGNSPVERQKFAQLTTKYVVKHGRTQARGE